MLTNWLVYLNDEKIIDVKSVDKPVIPTARSIFSVKERIKWPKRFVASINRVDDLS
jgi:hypothetical protein